MKNTKKLTALLVLAILTTPVVAKALDHEVMVVDAPSLPEMKSFKEQDFDAVIENRIPLEPDQIRQLHKLLDEQKRAAAEPVRETIGRSRQEVVDVSPGASMPVVSVNKGMVSTISFQDRHGAIWPVRYFKNGNDRDFKIEGVPLDVTQTSEQGEEGQNSGDSSLKSNAFTISTKSYSSGNVSVFLQGLATPIVVAIKSGDKYSDHRLDLIVNRAGPLFEGVRSAHYGGSKVLPKFDDLLLTVLSGVLPPGYQLKRLESNIGTTIYSDDRMFVRTAYKMISPQSKNMIKSADGTVVYEVDSTTVALMLIDGKVTKVRVK